MRSARGLPRITGGVGRLIAKTHPRAYTFQQRNGVVDIFVDRGRSSCGMTLLHDVVALRIA
jgi:hypothetical protein